MESLLPLNTACTPISSFPNCFGLPSTIKRVFVCIALVNNSNDAAMTHNLCKFIHLEFKGNVVLAGHSSPANGVNSSSNVTGSLSRLFPSLSAGQCSSMVTVISSVKLISVGPPL